MAFDRSKFQAPKLEVNRRASEEVDKTMKVNNSTRGDYLTIEEGINLFRLFPPHNLNEPSFQPKVVYWLECRVPKVDSNGDTIEGQHEWKRRPIFDSRVHGDTKKDIVDEYIKFTRDQIFANYETETAKKMMAAINGWRGRDGKWNPGILPSTSFVAYATKGDISIANLGRLELYQADKEQLEKLNIDDVSGEVLSTDIWSGPDDGLQFTLTLKKDDKGRWIRLIAKKQFSPKSKDVAKEWDSFVQSQVIPDDVLEHWSKMEPLSSQFKGVYRRGDFERALEGLQKFDEEKGLNTFQNDEFLKIVAELDAYYPEDDDTGNHLEDFENQTPANIDFSEMSREELKKINKEHKLGIRVVASMSTETLASMIEQKLSEAEEPEEDEIAETEVQAPYNAANAKPGAKTQDSSSAGAGPEPEEDDKLPWADEEEQSGVETPVEDAAARAKALREKLAGFKK